MRMGLKYCQRWGRGYREDNKPLVRASAGFPSCAALFVWSQLRLQYSASSDRAADMVHWCATQPADTWCTVPIHGAGGGTPFTSNQMIKNLVVSMGWYLNTRWWHHVAVISVMIIKIWAVDREYIDPNSRLGCDPTVLTHPYTFRTGYTRSEPIRLFVTSPDLTLR